MVTDFGQNCEMTFIQHAGVSFRTGFDYRNFDSKRFSGNIFSIYCANLTKIGPLSPEKMQIVQRFDDRRSFATCRSEMDWNITIILISAG